MKHASGDSSSPDHLLLDGQIKLLYKSAPLAYGVTLINGAILAFVQSTYIPFRILSVWYGGLVLITAFRGLLIWRYARDQPGPEHAHLWNNFYLIGAGSAGVIWGSAAVLLFPMDSIAHQVFVAFVLAGMAAGGISVLAPRMDACLAFLLPELLPLAVRFFTLPTTLHTVMGMMTLIFLASILISAWNFHLVIRNVLTLRFDKERLKDEIVQRHRAEEDLFQEKDRLQTTLSSIGEGVALVDADSRIEFLNPAAEQLCGWNYQQALHRPAAEIFENVDPQNQRVATALEESLRSAQQIRKQSVLCSKGGGKHVVDELATPLYDRHSNAVGAVSVFRDVTEAQQKTAELTHAAAHDALTGLPNRNLLKDRTRLAIARAQRKHERFALLFLDLDRFKEVNDRMGHASGDALLVDVAHRLAGCVREVDTIARLGGDEFVVLLEGPTHKMEVKAVAGKILASLRKPYQLGAQSTTISVSIGASLYPDDGGDTESLLEHADTAMYRAKQQGRDQFAL
ncbi:sensor domain-containing diguanylate cyclase [Noviherbaspirillum sp.]|jgi:diguanylate cyclase (GGDEF)-like protein/PAS domain S-box-containing protein|uniref:sensor domain-containing diguanylate cyclase n=1 Tax=Noviherbaspirillum sp. TaxID=1926288 RepID=UPI0025CD9EE2|nr:sensor domain-containing diguanylate cyclase [Noviherbaspirillum sp.]